jgi:hypothetical protein
MTFVLVGAGPTGVELAASLASMVRVTLRNNFRRIDPAKSTIILLDGARRILPTFGESVSRKVAEHLETLGVKVMTDAKVEIVDDNGVIAGGRRIPSATVLWTAGVAASPIPRMLGTKVDRAGRALVGPFLNIPAAEPAACPAPMALVVFRGRAKLAPDFRAIANATSGSRIGFRCSRLEWSPKDLGGHYQLLQTQLEPLAPGVASENARFRNSGSGLRRRGLRVASCLPTHRERRVDKTEMISRLGVHRFGNSVNT